MTASPHLVVDVERGPDDGGVANPSMHLVSETARRAGAGEVALGVDGDHPDRIVTLSVHLRHGIALFEPLLPRRTRFGCEQILPLETALQSELQRALTHEHDVWRFLHDPSRYGDGMLDLLQERDRATTAPVVHDRSIKRDSPVAVGKPTVPDRLHLRVRLGDLDAALDGVERASTPFEQPPRGNIGSEPMIPGRNDERFARGP
jgi:hypothetical protein